MTLGYVDPGAGSVVLQVLVVAVVGSVLALRRAWAATLGRLTPGARPRAVRAPSPSPAAAPAAVRDGLLGEARELLRLIRAPASAKAVVFYSEQESYRAYFEDVVAALAAGGVPVAYVTSDAADGILAAPPPGVRSFHLRRLLPFWLALCRSRVVVMTVMDLGRFPIRRSVHDVRYVHVFHGLNSTHMTCTATAFDAYDVLLCGGPHHVREVRERERRLGLRAKELAAAGYPRLDRIRRAFVARAAPPGPRPRVLVAPSWHAGNLLEAAGPAVVDALREAGCEVVVRPHAETGRRDPARVERLARELSREGVRVERSVLGDDALVDADVLVTDWSGIALEFAFATERPVVWVDLPPKVRNPAWEELGLEPVEVALRADLGVVLAPDRIGELGAAAADLVARRGEWGARIRAARERCVFRFGSSAEACARVVRAQLERPV